MFSLLHPFHQSADLAVDFGTAILRIGGAEGKRLHQFPSVAGIRPALCDGVITDMAAATAVLREAFSALGASHRHNLRVLACAPSDVSDSERQKLFTALHDAGAARSAIIPEPVAALVGARVDIGEGNPHLVIDFGEGVVDCAVIMEKRIHASLALRGGCRAFRAGLIAHLQKTENIVLNEAEAEHLLRRFGLEPPPKESAELQPDVPNRIPSNSIGTFLQTQTDPIIESFLAFLETIEPKICAEVIANGIRMTGGGSLIPGLWEYCSRKLQVPIERAARPLESVIHGACSILGPTSRLDLWDDLHRFWNAR